MTVGGHWFRGGSKRLLGLGSGSRAWQVFRGGSVGWVVHLAGDCGGATDGCRVGGCSHD